MRFFGLFLHNSTTNIRCQCHGHSPVLFPSSFGLLQAEDVSLSCCHHFCNLPAFPISVPTFNVATLTCWCHPSVIFSVASRRWWSHCVPFNTGGVLAFSGCLLECSTFLLRQGFYDHMPFLSPTLCVSPGLGLAVSMMVCMPAGHIVLVLVLILVVTRTSTSTIPSTVSTSSLTSIGTSTIIGTSNDTSSSNYY